MVVVGVRGGVPSDDPRFTLVDVATVNEFGSRDGRIPERSFLRSTIDRNRTAYLVKLGAAGLRALVGGRAGLVAALHRLGLEVATDVRRTIITLRTPPNAASTVRRKGSDNPLVDTGRLAQSVTWEVRMGGGAAPAGPAAGSGGVNSGGGGAP